MYSCVFIIMAGYDSEMGDYIWKSISFKLSHIQFGMTFTKASIKYVSTYSW